MKTHRAVWGSLIAATVLVSGCGQSPEAPPAQSPSPSAPPKVAARAPDKSQLNASLLRAVTATNATQVREILGQGADPRVKTKWGKPALQLACEKGSGAIVQSLLEQGAGLHTQISKQPIRRGGCPKADRRVAQAAGRAALAELRLCSSLRHPDPDNHANRL